MVLIFIAPPPTRKNGLPPGGGAENVYVLGEGLGTGLRAVILRFGSASDSSTATKLVQELAIEYVTPNRTILALVVRC